MKESNLQKNTVQETLCIPLWGRALAAEQFPHLFPDTEAARILREMEQVRPKKLLYKLQYINLNCVIRQYNLAWEISHYLKKHPNAAVVELGAGLSCLRRQMKNDKNFWYNLDMENVIALREKYVPKGSHEKNIVCNLNDFSWFEKIDFHPEDGIVFVGGGLFYYFEKEQVKRLFCAMAGQFPGGMIAFDATNALGLKGVNKEVKMAGNKIKSFFSLENPKKELEVWSSDIVNVSEKDYMRGYLKEGYHQSLITRFAQYIMTKKHLGFIVHAEFVEN